MLIENIRKEGKDVYLVQLSGLYQFEFSADLASKNKEYLEEFSLELIRTIRKKYPGLKKGTIKVLAGTVVIATLQLSGSQLILNGNSAYAVTITAEQTQKYTMSYLYYGTAQTQLSQLNEANGALNMVSPSYFNLQSDGTLQITSLYSKEFVDGAHAAGVSVVPFVSNHWDSETGKNALQNREKLASDIADAVALYGFDGIHVDIENMTETEKDMYTDLLRLLREKLPAGKEVSVAVAPNPYGWKNGWQGSYDYEALAKYSDYLMIMAYDEHYQGGAQGPVASLNFVEKSIQYALRYTTADKIVLGLPFYARYWQDGASTGGYGINLDTAVSLIDDYGGTVTYDYTNKTPMATVVIKDSDVKPVVGYKTLAAGTYRIWYEDGTSMREKLLLVTKYGLRGSGSWSLGQENSQVWDYYSKWQNGVYFSDIASNWAREEIMDAVLRGDMKGVNSATFEPNRNITRAEFVTLLLRKFNKTVNEDAQSTFSDTATHWASKEIATAAAEGIVFGAGDGKFYPDRQVTRGEAASILARLMALSPQEETATQFWDVGSDSTIRDDIYAVVEAGIFKGYEDGSFKPQQGFTRAETAVVTGRLSIEK